MAPVPMKVDKMPSEDLAFTNRVILPPGALPEGTRHCKLAVRGEQFYFTVQVSEQMGSGLIGMSGPQRKFAALALRDAVLVEAAVFQDASCYLGSITLAVDFFKKATVSKDRFDTKLMARQVLDAFRNQVFQSAQILAFNHTTAASKNEMFSLTVAKMAGLLPDGTADPAAGPAVHLGVLTDQTQVLFTVAEGSNVALAGAAAGAGGGRPTLFDPHWKFEDLGIGGLDEQFRTMFRRAFVSRIMPPDVVEKLGMTHVKGILLYGPPGTGKTLMARKIGQMLNGNEPKIVKGPEIMSKYVGESEENVRKLFAEAEAEYKAKGDNSSLHIIIFDEIDAICKQRGSTSGGTGVNDSVVNQLLSQIDGVDALNNILLIGMTNRMDMIDEALLRPGRLELKLQIGLPDEDGRRQIFNIHTKTMRESGKLGATVDLALLAASSKNFSGAEIAGVVRSAVSFASERCVQLTAGIHVDEKAAHALKVDMADFERALQEVRPAFGADEEQFEGVKLNGVVPWDAAIDSLLETGRLLAQLVANSARSPLVTLLLEGEQGSGKSSLAAEIAQASNFPYVKMIAPEQLVGLSELGKLAKLNKVFDDAYKSKLSVIVVDDIERLIEWVPIGARFSNNLLQALLVLFKKVPPQGHRLLLVATTSTSDVLRQMGMAQGFTKIASVPLVEHADQLEPLLQQGALPDADVARIKAAVQGRTVTNSFGSTVALRVGVKKVFSILEMARQSDETAATFIDALVSECRANAL